MHYRINCHFKSCSHNQWNWINLNLRENRAFHTYNPRNPIVAKLEVKSLVDGIGDLKKKKQSIFVLIERKTEIHSERITSNNIIRQWKSFLKRVISCMFDQEDYSRYKTLYFVPSIIWYSSRRRHYRQV